MGMKTSLDATNQRNFLGAPLGRPLNQMSKTKKPTFKVFWAHVAKQLRPTTARRMIQIAGELSGPCCTVPAIGYSKECAPIYNTTSYCLKTCTTHQARLVAASPTLAINMYTHLWSKVSVPSLECHQLGPSGWSASWQLSARANMMEALRLAAMCRRKLGIF